MDDFVKERNETFASMDKDKILAYCKKYKIEIPEDEEIFWASVHKVICNLYSLTDSPISDEQYNNSYNWLEERGYTPSFIDGNDYEEEI